MAIVALIPGSLGRQLKNLQRRLDRKGGDGLPPHIELVGAFRAWPSFLPLEQHCQEVCHRAAPFMVELGAPEIDEVERTVCAEIVSGEEQLAGLREALLKGKYAPRHSGTEFRPRALIARVEQEADLKVGRLELRAVDAEPVFEVERVELMARYPDGTWYERDFYTLDGVTAKA